MKIKSKIKLHLLRHGPRDIRRLGPLLGRMIETHEKANGVFRACSIYSNRLAPSRDIALQLAAQDCFKHLVTGGLFFDSEGEAIAASAKLSRYFGQQQIVQKSLGWTAPDTRPHGTVTRAASMAALLIATPGHMVLPAQRTWPDIQQQWKNTAAAQSAGTPVQHLSTSLWIPALSVRAQYKDDCKVGWWIFAQNPLNVGVLS
jgi:hypothetical protein